MTSWQRTEDWSSRRAGKFPEDSSRRFPNPTPGIGSVPRPMGPCSGPDREDVRAIQARLWHRRLDMDEITELAMRAQTGHPTATTAFVRATQADVWRLCAHLVDVGAADDLTQDTYLRALPALSGFRGDASARTWLLSIARRTCADVIRRRQRQRALVERLETRQHLRDSANATATGGPGEIDALIADLDDDRRSAFVLTQVIGLSYAEAAEVSACPVGTIRSRVARARLDLIAALDADLPERLSN